MTVPYPDDVKYLPELGVDCFYTWHYLFNGEADEQFIPMIRTLEDGNKILAEPELLEDSPIVLLFNECDADPQAGQCVGTPQEAANMTRALQQAFPQVEHWGAPVVHCDEQLFEWACDNPNWLPEYLEACEDCDLDFLALHYYGFSLPYNSQWSCTPDNLERWVDKNDYGLPIWLTEWSCLSLAPQYDELQVEDMDDLHDWIEEDERVVANFPWTMRYGLGGIFDTSNFVEGGELTEFGEWYGSLTP